MHGGQQQRQGAQQGYGQGYYNQISPQQLQKVQEIQANYADEVYDLSSQLYAKQQELASLLMSGEEMEASKRKSLVNEINELRGQLFATRVEMQQKLLQSGALSSYGGYGMMGPGMMHGGGYGMGPGMMHGGPGMMGPGMMHGGYGMGPGMMRGGYNMVPGMMGPSMNYGGPYQDY